MTSPCRPDRRAFLQGALSSITGLALAAGCATDVPYDDVTLARPAVLQTLQPVRVREIGQAYLRDTPAESTGPTLRAAIVRSARDHRDVPWSPWPTLDTLIASDFVEDRVVFPAGWMLSVNEARQCALFALQA